MNAAADLQAALITFTSTVFTLGVVAIVVGVVVVLLYLVIRNSMTP